MIELLDVAEGLTEGLLTLRKMIVMKNVLKTLGVLAMGGAVGGVAQWAHGIDPNAVACAAFSCSPWLHQIGVAAGTGALTGVISLFIKKPGQE